MVHNDFVQLSEQGIILDLLYHLLLLVVSNTLSWLALRAVVSCISLLDRRGVLGALFLLVLHFKL